MRYYEKTRSIRINDYAIHTQTIFILRSFIGRVRRVRFNVETPLNLLKNYLSGWWPLGLAKGLKNVFVYFCNSRNSRDTHQYISYYNTTLTALPTNARVYISK